MENSSLEMTTIYANALVKEDRKISSRIWKLLIEQQRYVVIIPKFSAKKKKIVIAKKNYIEYLLFLVIAISTNQVAYSQFTKSDSINIDKVNVTKKLYREIRYLTKELGAFNLENKIFTIDTTGQNELKSQLIQLQEKIKEIETRQDRSYLPIKEQVKSNSFTTWLIPILVFFIGLLIGYILPKKKAQ